jgi:signal transduction histidine kinase
MSRRFGWSLNARLAALVLVGVLPGLAFGALSLWTYYRIERDRAAQATLEISRSMASAVDRELQRSVAGLQALALSESLARGDFAAFRSHAERFVAQQHPGAMLILADSNGRQLVNTALEPDDAMPPRVNLEVVRRVFETGQPVVTGVFHGSVRRNAVSIDVPVMHEGEVRYDLALSPALDTFAEIIRQQRPQPGWVVSVVDPRGVNVARTPGAERFSGEPLSDSLRPAYLASTEGILETTSLEGTPLLTSFSRATPWGWGVAIGRPLAELTAPLWRSLSGFAVAALSMAALGLAGASWLARRIRQPIVALGEQASVGASPLAREAPTPVASGIVEVDTVAVALHDAVATLRGADRRKDEFIAMLAHELRNPLAPLTNSHRLMRRRVAHDAEAIALVDMAERQTAQLTRLVDDLLEISRITEGKIELRMGPVDLCDAAERVAAAFRDECGQRGHSLEVAVPGRPVMVRADPARVSQILENLVGNACKYTPDGGRIRIVVERLPAGVELRVEDTGVGIEPALVPRLFEPFYQVDASIDRAQGGLGLGLALVRRLAVLHGGTASASSEGRGRGSCFVVTLPDR